MLIRGFAFFVFGSAIWALLPMVAAHRLGGGPQTYGTLAMSFGLGAIIGAAAGLLFAPKAGTETREDLSNKFKELKGKTEEWVAEQKAKKRKLDGTIDSALEEVGA